MRMCLVKALLAIKWRVKGPALGMCRNRWSNLDGLGAAIAGALVSFWCLLSGNKHAEMVENPTGGFRKWWYPKTIAFPTKNDHLGVIWGYHYHHFRKHPTGRLNSNSCCLVGWIASHRYIQHHPTIYDGWWNLMFLQNMLCLLIQRMQKDKVST